jgi:hypothetical protein
MRRVSFSGRQMTTDEDTLSSASHTLKLDQLPRFQIHYINHTIGLNELGGLKLQAFCIKKVIAIGDW